MHAFQPADCMEKKALTIAYREATSLFTVKEPTSDPRSRLCSAILMNRQMEVDPISIVHKVVQTIVLQPLTVDRVVTCELEL